MDNLEAYFRKLVYARDRLLLQLEQEAQQEEIPIIGPVVGELLSILATVMGAKHILELGTATGYSAIYLAHGCEAVGGNVITLENDPQMVERAQNNIRAAGLEETVSVILTDALEAIAAMSQIFDLIFIDIEKEDYIRALPDCYRLLRSGGLLVADNVSYKGADAFNKAIFSDRRWKTVNLYSYLPLHSPEKDAICLALRL
jgi:predicted O-methyltransferase YrrM